MLFFTCALASCSNNGNDNEHKPPGDDTVAVKTRYIRKNANSPEAQKDLEAMNIAFDKMRAMDCSEKTSWYYQAAMHWVPDSIGDNPLCPSYRTYPDKKECWDNCTHTSNPELEVHFLIWHRMYIWHIEKIIRKVSGYNDFALPYWGYCNKEDSLKNRTMPSLFRDSSSSVFEQSRFDSLNMGNPIDGPGTRALALNQLFDNKLYYTFNSNIDQAPHGAMHDYIGLGNGLLIPMTFNRVTNKKTNYGLMSSVPTAAFDPIFWTHHSNIDRLWQQWTNSPNGQQVTKEMLKDAPWPYEFYDENGKKVVYSIEQVLKVLYNMDYDFDDTKVYAKAQKKKLMAYDLQGIPAVDTMASKKMQVKMTNNSTAFSISVPADKAKEVMSLDSTSIVLVSVVVSFKNKPEGNYEIYLDLPKGSGIPYPDASEDFVGFMTFFGADHRHPANHAGHDHHPSDGRIRKTFKFDITSNIMDDITHEEKLDGDFNFSIYRYNAKPGEELIIEKVSVANVIK